MIVKANEIKKYMEIHSVDKVPVEVVVTDVPECKELRQGARKLAKRLVITAASNGKFGGGYKTPGMDAVRVNYAMYNSFKKSQCYLPPEWELEILAGEVGEKVLKEFAEHGGNLEKKFRDTFAAINPQIQEKIKEAAKLLAEAEKLSEDNGLPFYPESSIVDGMAQGYFPQSFESIFGDLTEEENEVVNELTGVYKYEDYTGWQSSSNSC